MSTDPITLVIDASVLSPFGRAGRLQELQLITEGYRRVTVGAVRAELHAGSLDHPRLLEVGRVPWLSTVATDTPAVLSTFADYRMRFGSGPRDIGDAAVLAYAKVHAAEAMLDDQTAYDIGVSTGVTVRRTLGLIARALRTSKIDEHDASALVDDLRTADARLPCDGVSFVSWCRQKGLV